MASKRKSTCRDPDACSPEKVPREVGNFLIEPIGEKSVTELHGVGPKIARKLKGAGYDTAFSVFGQYLVLKRNQELFEFWFMLLTRSNVNHARKCYTCLNEWFGNFMV